MAFEVGESELLSLGPPTFSADERRESRVLAETVEDVVAIERLARQALEPRNGRFDDHDRVRLRRARLLLEGQVVHAMRHPINVIAPESNPPQVVVAAAGTLDLGGAEVPRQTVMRRPTMTATESGAAPDSGPTKTFRMEPPDGEQFLAWVPRLVEVSGDEDLVVTRSWDLICIDEELQLLTGRASPRPRATDVVRPGRSAGTGVILGLDGQQGLVRLAEMTSTRNLFAYGIRTIRTGAFMDTTRDSMLSMLSIGVEMLFELTLRLIAVNRDHKWPAAHRYCIRNDSTNATTPVGMCRRPRAFFLVDGYCRVRDRGRSGQRSVVQASRELFGS